MVRRPTLRRITVIGLAGSLTFASCGSDGAGNDGFGIGQPVVTDAPGTPTTDASSPTTQPSDATAPDDTAEPSPTAPPAPTTTELTGPLPEPTVSLLEVGRFDQPVDLVARPGTGELFVVEQPGRVVAVTDLSSEVVLDITGLTTARGERGLLGLAFHPTEDLAYVHYTDGSGSTVVDEYAVDPLSTTFDLATRREVLTVDQPYSNHNGGQLAFGPDQLLYIGLGDGGSGGDPDRYALDLSSRLGKILRIDPTADGDTPFTVPADNPFVDTPGADPTIWAYGLRNPWKFSFDRPTGDLWIADVGQGDFEEINRSLADADRMNAGRGVSYGWSAFEGFEPFNRDQPGDGAQLPLFVYDHGGGRCSVSGGTVARGEASGNLTGWYVFGDYCSGQIWALDTTAPPNEPRVVEIAQLDTLVAVAKGPDGDLYAVSNAGPVVRLVATA